MTKGRFIVIEGIDGSGKGTQSKLLVSWLQGEGRDAVLTMEPTESRIGKVLRDGLKKGSLDPSEEALLFAADRVGHTKWIKKELQRGYIVVSDRYLPSSLAYQGAHGLEREWLINLNRMAIEPDLLIILDLPPEQAVARVNQRGGGTDYLEQIDFLERVRAIYLDLEKAIVLDASKSIEALQDEIRRIVLMGRPRGGQSAPG